MWSVEMLTCGTANHQYGENIGFWRPIASDGKHEGVRYQKR